jgi:hypothetical protein
LRSEPRTRSCKVARHPPIGGRPTSLLASPSVSSCLALPCLALRWCGQDGWARGQVSVSPGSRSFTDKQTTRFGPRTLAQCREANEKEARRTPLTLFACGVPRVHFSGGAAELLRMSASVRTYRRHRMALALACASLVHALDAGSFRTGPRPPGRPFRASLAATVNVAKDFSVDEESLRCVREPFSTIRVHGSRTRPRHRACGAALSADSSSHLAPAPF